MDFRQIDFIWICPDWASIFLVNFKLGDSAIGYVQRQSHKSGDANDTFLVWSFIVVKALDGYMVVWSRRRGVAVLHDRQRPLTAKL
ncbi:hypothetical protein D3C87_1242320 [compost metagenome]